MNEQLENALATLINKSVEGVESSIDFLQAEIPEVVYQLLMWNMISNLIIGSLMLLLSLLWIYWGIYVPLKSIKRGIKEKVKTLFTDEDGDIEPHFPILMVNLVIILPIAGSLNRLMEALKIWIAPKVWLLEYAASLVK